MNNNRGYTIMEALIAIVVISILAMPIYRLLNTEKQLSTKARDRLSAYLIASSEMEKLKSVSTPLDEIVEDEYEIEMNHKNYKVERLIKNRFDEFGEIVDETGKQLKEITIKVTLNNRRMAILTGLFGGLEGDKVEENDFGE